MKNVIKTKLSSLAILLPLLFLSCNDISNNESEQNSGGKARVTLSCASQSRSTVMPTDMTSEDTVKATLTAEKLGTDKKYAEYTFDNGETSLEWAATTDDDGFIKESALEIMQKDSVLLDFGTYNFTLSIYTKDQTSEEEKLRLTQSGLLEKFEVSEKTKSLEFTTEYVKYGNLALTFKWPCDEDNKSKISKIEAGLFTLASKGESAFEFEDASYKFEALTIEDIEISGEPTVKTALYSKDEIPNGTYYLKYRVYDDSVSSDTPLNTILDVVKIHGYKTEKTIDIDPEEINSWQRKAGSNITTPSYEDTQIHFNCEPDDELYLNKGSINISAFDPAGEQIDTSAITATLFYGGSELDDSFYQWNDDGFVLLGTGEKLVTGGTYQLYVSATATVDSETITESAMFDITVEGKEYHYLNVNDETYTTVLAEIIKNLETDALLVVSGTGTNTTNSDTGTMAQISEIINENNYYYKVDLDYSQLTGVTATHYNDFSDNMISSIILPETVETIAETSFGSSYDYGSNSLKSVTFPAGVTTIAAGAFGSNCKALEKIIFTGTNEKYSTNKDGTVLYEKGEGDELTLLLAVGNIKTIDFEKDFPEVTSVAGRAFELIGQFSSVKNFGDVKLQESAFYNTKIETLTLDKLIEVESETYPFNSATVKNLIVNFDVTEENYDKFKYLVAEKTGDYVYGMENIESVVFNKKAYFNGFTPSSSEYDEPNKNSLFYSSSNTLKNLEFNDSATIGYYQFYCFRNLSNLKFSSDSTIKLYAFAQNRYSATGVTNLDLTGVTEIGSAAFENNTGLTEVEIPATLTSINYDSFDGCSNLTKFTVADGSAYSTKNEGKFLCDTNGTRLVLSVPGITGFDFTDSGITTVGQYAFRNSDTAFTSLNLTGVVHVEMQAFYNMYNLTSINWGTTLKSIGNMAFYRVGVTSVELPPTVIAIACNAFQRSTSSYGSNPIETFTIGEVSSSDANQPSGWYKLTSEDTWKGYIETKPSSIEANGTNIISLSEEGSTASVLATIQSNTCGTSGSGYYYRFK